MNKKWKWKWSDETLSAECEGLFIQNSISNDFPAVELKKTVSQLLFRTKLDGVLSSPPSEFTAWESRVDFIFKWMGK